MNFRDDIIDLINIIKEDRLDREQSSTILERHRYKNYKNLVHKIKLVEAQFLADMSKTLHCKKSSFSAVSHMQSNYYKERHN